MIDLEPESTLALGVNASVGRDRQAFKDRLSAIGSAILEDGLLEGSRPDVGFYELARLFQYFTLQVSLAKEPRTATRGNPHVGERGGKTADHQRRDRRDWKPLKTRYDELCRLLPSTPLATVDVPRLRQFCDYESLRHGARDPRFYATLLVLAAYMEERGDFRGERFERAVPICERDLGVRIRRLVEERLLVPFALPPHGVLPGRQAVLPSPTDETEGRLSTLADSMPGQQAHRAPSIYLRVAYRSADADRFDEYRRWFVHGERGAAHFIVYRPSRSRPNRLMKSFLSLSARSPERYGDQEPDVFNFTHIYAPPAESDGSTPRITLGRVFPLEHGVYLVGGQRNYFSDDRMLPDRPPARALKSMVLPWAKLGSRESIVPMLAMSNNYDGFQLVSRAALRATPLEKSNQLRIGSVDLEDLFDDLLDDSGRERMHLAGLSDRFQLCGRKEPDVAARRAVRAIQRYTNNAPDSMRGWDIEPGYTGGRGENLTREAVRKRLNAAFDQRGRPIFSRADVEPEERTFSLERSLRYGPLTQPE